MLSPDNLFCVSAENLHPIAENDLLAVMDAGAYCAVMASSYNSRPKPAEVLVRGTEKHLIRERDSIASLMENERIIE